MEGKRQGKFYTTTAQISQLKPYNNDDTLTKTREKTVTMKEVRRKKTRTQKIQKKSEKKLKSHGHGTDDCQPTYKTMK